MKAERDRNSVLSLTDDEGRHASLQVGDVIEFERDSKLLRVTRGGEALRWTTPISGSRHHAREEARLCDFLANGAAANGFIAILAAAAGLAIYRKTASLAAQRIEWELTVA